MNRMRKFDGVHRFRPLLAYVPGLLMLSLGIYLIIAQPQASYIQKRLYEGIPLREGTDSYEVFEELKITFRVYLFDVTNRQDVMVGDNPILREVGPFVYDLYVKKHIIGVDEVRDEINYTVTKTYYFNQKESGNLTENTELTVLNFAYVGTVRTILNMFPNFLKKLGPVLHKIFPKTVDIFQKATAGAILFSGLPLDCVNVDKSLNLICNFLKGNPPPILKTTDTPGILLYSIFHRVNGTHQGPFTVNRGIKDIYSMGNTTSYKNMRVTNFWNTEACNTVSGSDTVTWPPMLNKLPKVQVYEAQLCRSLSPAFTREEIWFSLTGYRYELKMDSWNKKEMECYCKDDPKKQMKCFPTGLMDITKCQGVPVIYSEPHFLHASSEILDYVHGLTPSDKHVTFIIIDPLTGAPLTGSKKIQLNMEISATPDVPLMSNVTDGFFPLLWGEETSVATMKEMRSVINLHRLVNVCNYLTWPLLFIGIWLIITAGLRCESYYKITHQRYARDGAFQ